MIVTCQIIDVFAINLSIFICFNNVSNIQIFRFHIFVTIYQNDQAVASLNSFYETNASVASFNISIRFILTNCCYRISKAYQIFTIYESCFSRFSVNATPFICRITLSVFMTTRFVTRSTLVSSLIITRYRNQILRFDITQTTCYPSSVNTE